MAKTITVEEFRRLRESGAAHAPIDVREPAEYNTAHIPNVYSLPRRWLEFRMRSFVPFLGTPVIVVDDDGRRSELAAATIEAMGYSDVSVLKGGTNRWAADDQPTEWGVNVPSKDFGEKVLLQGHVPEISADELHAWQEEGKDFVLVDSRTPEEHHRMCIPGARSMPGAELGLRIWELGDGEDRPIVVHCAGRTRSIIGAGTLLRMGATNVYALKNGTSGWRLSGFELETGSNRVDLPEPTPDHRRSAEARARKAAVEDGVRFEGVFALDALREQAAGRNVYLFDVRNRQEYDDGHIPGFSWAPGGQLVQATDSYIGVVNSLVVLACDGVTRAAMTGSWLKQMGFPEVVVIDGGTRGWTAVGRTLETGIVPELPAGLNAARSQLKHLSPEQLKTKLRETWVIHVGGSDEFAAGHVPGSRWVPRGYLELRVAEAVPSKYAPVVVTCSDGVSSALTGATLRELGYADVSLLEGGMKAWRDAGLDVETGLSGVMGSPDDVLPPSRSFADMMNYLRWEELLGHKYEEEAPSHS
ncbi:MAG: rhodanese-like domain-containing protein [Dehalococcoidia bacterium]